MKIFYYILSLLSVLLFSCSSDNEIVEDKKSNELISLVFEDSLFEFKNIHHGKYTDENRELIGFFVESEIVIDEKHKNRIRFIFITDFEARLELESIEFMPFKPGPNYPHNVFSYVYQYFMDDYGSPFTYDFKLENGRVTGSFEGYIHRSNSPSDMVYMQPIYLSSGEIDIEAKTTNN